MTGLKRAFAVCVSTVILGMQFWVILPPDPSGRWKEKFWPFVRYPMYAIPKYRGDVIAAYRLTGNPCMGGPAREISLSELGLGLWVFIGQARAISAKRSADPDQWSRPPEQAARNIDILTELVRSHIPEPICTVHLWEQAIVLGEPGDPYNAPWALMRSWPVSYEEKVQ